MVERVCVIRCRTAHPGGRLAAAPPRDDLEIVARLAGASGDPGSSESWRTTITGPLQCSSSAAMLASHRGCCADPRNRRDQSLAARRRPRERGAWRDPRIALSNGKTPAGRTGAGPGGQRPLLDGLRERRVLDLLRARSRRRARARPDADRLPDHGPLLPVHRGHLRRGDRDVPRGRRVLELRAPRVQRVLVVLRRLGPDAQLRRDGRDLRVLRPALPRQRVLGGAAALPGRHHRRRDHHRDPGRDQRVRGQGVGGPEHRARGRRLPHAGAAGDRRRGARARRQPGPAGRQRRAGASRRRGRTSSSRSRSA